jgi:hypothetical protein
MKRPRYQLGTLYSEPRKKGPGVWVYRWRENDGQGRRTLRKQIVGTVRELRTQTDAQRAAEALRLNINRHAVEQTIVLRKCRWISTRENSGTKLVYTPI